MSNRLDEIPTIPSAVSIAPGRLTDADRQRISAAVNELDRLEEKLAQVSDLKSTCIDAGRGFAAGRLTLPEAIFLTSLASDTAARHAAEGALRTPLKQAIRSALGSVADLVTTARGAKAEELRRRANALEATERKAQAAAGLPQDGYVPSPAVAALAAQRLTVLRDRDAAPTAQEVRELLASYPAKGKKGD